MKAVDVNKQTVSELRALEKELKAEVFEMKMKNSLGQLGNPVEIRHKRRDLARVKTALSQKVAN